MSARDPDSLNDTDRAFLRMIVESNAELGRSVYEVHGIVGRIDERQAAFIEAIGKRLDQHSEKIDETAANLVKSNDRLDRVERRVITICALFTGGVAVIQFLFGK